MKEVNTHLDLDVYILAFQASMEIFNLTKGFPKEEMYSLSDQIRRSSRSVCANLAEAFRKRKYPAHFVSKLSDAEAEAAETQTWITYAEACRYLDPAISRKMLDQYNSIIGKLVRMAQSPEKWTFSK